MRLICGILRLDGMPAGADMLAAMLAAQSIGRPAAIRRHVAGPVALAVQDFTEPAAPLSDDLPSAPNGSVLAADLRLDRPRELAAMLGQPAGSQAEALALAAIARWGIDMPDRVDGDFAMAAWSPGRRELTLFTDIFGTRPLCWTHVPGRMFLFASLPRAIVRPSLIPATPDLTALGHLLVRRPGLGTGICGLQWLPANSSLTVSIPAGPARHHRPWQPDPAPLRTWRGSRAEAAAELRTLLSDAVACRLPADGPTGAHLSGGLDSSALTVLAARQLRPVGRQLHAFSHLESPTATIEDDSEKPYIQAVLDQENDISWHASHLTGLTPVPVLTVDDPGAGPGEGADDHMYAAAAAAGIAVMLSGHGGDETATFHGRNLHLALLRSGCWSTLADDIARRPHVMGRPRWELALDLLVRPLIPDWAKALRHRLRGTRPARTVADQLDYLHPDIAAAVRRSIAAMLDPHGAADDRIRLLTDELSAVRTLLFARRAAGFGIATTFPMLDRRVVDFCLSLPPHLLVRDGYSRQPFRDAMRGILPEDVRLRTDKLLAFPDRDQHLVKAKPRLLARLDVIRHRPEAQAFADFGKVEPTLRAMPDTGGMTTAQALETQSAALALTVAGNLVRLADGLP